MRVVAAAVAAVVVAACSSDEPVGVAPVPLSSPTPSPTSTQTPTLTPTGTPTPTAMPNPKPKAPARCVVTIAPSGSVTVVGTNGADSVAPRKPVAIAGYRISVRYVRGNSAQFDVVRLT